MRSSSSREVNTLPSSWSMTMIRPARRLLRHLSELVPGLADHLRMIPAYKDVSEGIKAVRARLRTDRFKVFRDAVKNLTSSFSIVVIQSARLRSFLGMSGMAMHR